MMQLFDDDGALGWTRTRLAFAWVVVAALAYQRGQQAWDNFNDGNRPDGNYGHMQIDFGGQYMLGRVLVEGHGPDLYTRERHLEIARQRFPREHEAPGQDKSDAEKLVDWFPATEDKVVSGPLYPPIHAFVMAPVAAIDSPQVAYRVWQAAMLLWLIAGGWAARVISRGAIWWPVGAAMLIGFSGARSGLDLGQNCALTVTLILAGWALRTRGRPVLAGVVWGLLAFKPVWAMSFFGALVFLRQWRMLAAMGATGLGLIAATLPVVGVECWKNWLAVGKVASAIYLTDSNWIHLSRDVFGIPRRFMLTFIDGGGQAIDDRPAVAYVGWAIWGFIAGVTAFVAWRRRLARHLHGPGPALAFLAAWLCTYRFMYYDSLIAAAGVMVLLAQPGRFLRWSSWPIASWGLALAAAPFVIENLLVPQGVQFTLHFPRRPEDYSDVTAAVNDHYAWDTVAVFALWAWCVRTVWFRWDDEFV